ncbi:MAG: hypothetical protein C0449_14715 [Polaromonas sp.]|nr:hypothetical protein [Polaromonas sp.]
MIMIPGFTKAAILKAVINGSTLAEAASQERITNARARSALQLLCRRFRLPAEVSDIQAHPERYAQALGEFEASPEIGLGRALATKLTEALKLSSPKQVTPAYLSNISATQLLERGLTIINLHQIETWLSSSGKELKRSPPRTDWEIQEVNKAISLLHTFFFDVSAAKGQFEKLLSRSESQPVMADE